MPTPDVEHPFPDNRWIFTESPRSPQDNPDRRDEDKTALAPDHVKRENADGSYWQANIWVNGTWMQLDSRSPQPGLEGLHKAYDKLGAAVREATKALPAGPCTVTIRTNPNDPSARPSIEVHHLTATKEQVDSVVNALAKTLPDHLAAAHRAMSELTPQLQELATLQKQARGERAAQGPVQRIPRPTLWDAPNSPKHTNDQALGRGRSTSAH